MKNSLFDKLFKYIIILLIDSLLFTPWAPISNLQHFILYDEILTYGDYVIRLTTVILLLFDLRKEKLQYLVLGVLGGLFYPLLGITILAILYLEKQTKAYA